MAKIIKLAEENYSFRIFSLAEMFMSGDFQKFKFLAEDAVDLLIQFSSMLELACVKGELKAQKKKRLYEKSVQQATYSMYGELIPRMLNSEPFKDGNFMRNSPLGDVLCDNLILYYEDKPLILAIYENRLDQGREWLEVFHIDEVLIDILEMSEEKVSELVYELFAKAMDRFNHGGEAYKKQRPPINFLASQQKYFLKLASQNGWELAGPGEQLRAPLLTFNC